MSQDLMQSTKEEQEFWCNAVRGLPGLEGFLGTGYDEFGERIQWGTGPHSLQTFREVFEIVKPESIFEIGFQMGYASAVFLNLSDSVKVFSCDISVKAETKEAARILKERYANRFAYYNRHDPMFAEKLLAQKFTMCFVDGGHLEKDILDDIDTCLLCKIPYLLFDDWQPQFSQAQDCVKMYPELELIKEFSNMALYKNTSA